MEAFASNFYSTPLAHRYVEHEQVENHQSESRKRLPVSAAHPQHERQIQNRRAVATGSVEDERLRLIRTIIQAIW